MDYIWNPSLPSWSVKLDPKLERDLFYSSDTAEISVPINHFGSASQQKKLQDIFSITEPRPNPDSGLLYIELTWMSNTCWGRGGYAQKGFMNEVFKESHYFSNLFLSGTQPIIFCLSHMLLSLNSDYWTATWRKGEFISCCKRRVYRLENEILLDWWFSPWVYQLCYTQQYNNEATRLKIIIHSAWKKKY